MSAIGAERSFAIWQEALRVFVAGGTAEELASAANLTHDAARMRLGTLRKQLDPEAFVASKALAVPTQTVPETLAEAASAAAAREDAARDRRLLNTLLKERGLEDRLIEAATAVVSRIPPAVIPPMPRLTKSDREPQHAVLLASDWHIGALVDPAETGGMGGYDFDTFCARLELLGRKVALITGEFQTIRPIRKLTVPLIGDIVDGDSIFPSQEVDFNVLDQVYRGALKTAEFLTGLLHTFQEVEVIALPGNHGRLGKKAERKKGVSFDRQLAMFASHLTKGTTRIKWAIPESPFYDWEIEGHPIHAEHYDAVKSWAGIPYYGLDRAAGKLTQIANSQGRRFSLMVGGHYHSGATLERPGGIVMLNGSMMGPTEFSAHELKTISRPMQRLFFVSREHGVNSDHWLWLDEVQRAA